MATHSALCASGDQSSARRKEQQDLASEVRDLTRQNQGLRDQLSDLLQEVEPLRARVAESDRCVGGQGLWRWGGQRPYM